MPFWVTKWFSLRVAPVVEKIFLVRAVTMRNPVLQRICRSVVSVHNAFEIGNSLRNTWLNSKQTFNFFTFYL